MTPCRCVVDSRARRVAPCSDRYLSLLRPLSNPPPFFYPHSYLGTVHRPQPVARFPRNRRPPRASQPEVCRYTRQSARLPSPTLSETLLFQTFSAPALPIPHVPPALDPATPSFPARTCPQRRRSLARSQQHETHLDAEHLFAKVDHAPLPTFMRTLPQPPN